MCVICSPCIFSGMCLYYNHLEMQGKDFVHDSALMSLACYGEIVSGMFVLFLPVLPRFFSQVKLSVSHLSKESKSSPPEFSGASTIPPPPPPKPTERLARKTYRISTLRDIRGDAFDAHGDESRLWRKSADIFKMGSSVESEMTYLSSSAGSSRQAREREGI